MIFPNARKNMKRRAFVRLTRQGGRRPASSSAAMGGDALLRPNENPAAAAGQVSHYSLHVVRSSGAGSRVNSWPSSRQEEAEPPMPWVGVQEARRGPKVAHTIWKKLCAMVCACVCG